MAIAVNQIDHVVIEAQDEDAVFALFVDKLGLPVGWPVRQWGLIREGGVTVGDANIGCNHLLDPNSDASPAIRAIALEPAASDEVILDALERRGIACSEAMASGDLDLPDALRSLPWAAGWSTRLVMPWRGGLPTAFLCRYNHDCGQRRAAEVAQLRSADGGVLGVTRLREVVVQTTDFAVDVRRWRDLLTPADEPETGYLRMARGPNFRLERGSADGFVRLVFEVESITRATAALAGIGIGWSDEPAGGIRLESTDVLGLDLRCVDDAAHVWSAAPE